MLTPSLKFLLGRCEEIAVAVIEVFRRTGARAKKLRQLRVGRSEMVVLHIFIELASCVTPRFFVALAGLDFAPVFDCLVGFLEVRFLRTL